MKKLTRVLCLVLCLMMLAPTLVACGAKELTYGPQINMYLSSEVYNFDPAYAYLDVSAAKVLGLMYEGLFTIDNKGNLEKAMCTEWVRTWSLKSGKLLLEDEFRFSDRVDETCINFITQGAIYLPNEEIDGYVVKEGELVISARSFDKTKVINVKMTYPKELKPRKETKVMTDKRLIKCWGKELNRVQLVVSKDAPLQGKYVYKFVAVALRKFHTRYCKNHSI